MTDEARTEDSERIVRTACSSHCGGRCLLRIHVRDGVITRIETDDGAEPQIRACLRCHAYRQRLYDPNRIKYPMKRNGERGEGKFARISWDEALDTVAAELTRIRKTYGPTAVVFLASAGDQTELHHNNLFHELLTQTGGYTQRWGNPSFEGGLFASLGTYGTLSSVNDYDDLLRSRLIILWGCDPATSIHEANTTWYLIQAREAGTKIITVDPRYTNSAAILAKQWIPLFPGTDAAMLVAMAYVLIKKDLHKQGFLDKYTVGFERFRDYVLGVEDGLAKSPAWAVPITGVPAEIIEGLAVEYATAKPAALIAGISPGRTAFGEQFHRAAKTLAAMTGNIGISGGWAGRSFAPSVRSGGFDFKFGKVSWTRDNPTNGDAPPPSAKGAPGSARIHLADIPEALLQGKAGGYPADLKMILVMHTNPVNQYPNTNKLLKGIKKMEFIAVAEQVMSATARYADILLPVCTIMERNDLTVGGSPPFYGYVRKVVDPLYESRSPFDICVALAQRFGLSPKQGRTEDEQFRAILKGSYVPDYERFRSEAIYKVERQEPLVAFKRQIDDPKNAPFPTASGKMEIYSKKLADMNHPEIPAIPQFMETWESRNDPLATRYPLQLITSHSKRRAHTQFENCPWLKELVPQAISMNPIDAGRRAIKNGDEVRVFNDRGEVRIPAHVTERIMPGVVDLPEGAWYNPDERGIDRGGSANLLSRDARSPGGASCYNTCLVQVEKA